jgi:hypothetical protein
MANPARRALAAVERLSKAAGKELTPIAAAAYALGFIAGDGVREASRKGAVLVARCELKLKDREA